MLTIGRVYKIRDMILYDAMDGRKMTILKISDANMGKPVFYDLRVEGTVIANKGDRITIGKITGVNSKAFNPKEPTHVFTNCQIYCEISGQNVIPN